MSHETELGPDDAERLDVGRDVLDYVHLVMQVRGEDLTIAEHEDMYDMLPSSALRTDEGEDGAGGRQQDGYDDDTQNQQLVDAQTVIGQHFITVYPDIPVVHGWELVELNERGAGLHAQLFADPPAPTAQVTGVFGTAGAQYDRVVCDVLGSGDVWVMCHWDEDKFMPSGAAEFLGSLGVSMAYTDQYGRTMETHDHWQVVQDGWGPEVVGLDAVRNLRRYLQGLQL